MILYGHRPMLTIGEGRAKGLPAYMRRQKQGVSFRLQDHPPAERDRYLGKVAIDHYQTRLRNDPADLSMYVVKKFFRLWYSTESGNNHGATFAINFGLYILAGIGIMLSWKQGNRKAFAMLVLVGYFVFIHWMTLPLFRYMIPVMPYLSIFAAMGMLSIANRKWPQISQKIALLQK